MRQRAHHPVSEYGEDTHVIDGKPVYEPGAVPEGLLTLKQLDKERLKYGPDQEPAAWLRYIPGGTLPARDRPSRVAPLYARADSVAKRPCSPAQLAVLEAARDQQLVCDECGRAGERRLQPGQRCPTCALKLDIRARIAQIGGSNRTRRSIARDLSARLDISYTAALHLVRQALGESE